jgi:hypothetical protein
MPSGLPTAQPSGEPSSQPSGCPTLAPTSQPSSTPSYQPTMMPSSRPTVQPSSTPSSQPSRQPSSQPSRQPSVKPSNQPTTTPSRQPSGQPSATPSNQPSDQPTGRPTSIPSTVPTTVPTSVPTTVPFTSSPTFAGQTIRPTAFPTSKPSVNVKDYGSSDLYKQFRNIQKTVDSQERNSLRISYNNFFYKSSNIFGTCDDWENLKLIGLNMPFDDVYVSSIKVYLGYEDLNEMTLMNTSATCSDATAVRGIVNAIKYSINYDAMCDGHKWRVFSCSSYSSFCIDCKAGCTMCPGSSFLNSPCKPCQNLRNNQRASYSIFSFGTSIIAAFPSFQSPILITTYATNVTVLVKLTIRSHAFSHKVRVLMIMFF